MKVFVSYRRRDSQDMAARIADRLNDTPGVREVFIDVEDIEPGADFASRIDTAMAESDVCLVLIGEAWSGAGPDARAARILDEQDYVRREVASALVRADRVIPVLLNGATMPPAAALPDELGALTTMNAVFVRHVSFDQDIELVRDAIFKRRPPEPLARFFRRRPLATRVLAAVGGIVAAAVLLVILAAIHSALTGGRALEETMGSRGLVWMLILLFAVAGAVVCVRLVGRR